MMRRKQASALYRQVRQDMDGLRADEAAWLASFCAAAPGKTLRDALHGIMSAFAAEDYARAKQFVDLLQLATINESLFLVGARRAASAAVGDYRFEFVPRSYISKTGEEVRGTMKDPLIGITGQYDLMLSFLRIDRFDFGHNECERLIEQIVNAATFLTAEDSFHLSYREHHTFKTSPSRFEEEICSSCFSVIDSFDPAFRCGHCESHVHQACKSDAIAWSNCAPPYKTAVTVRQHARNYRWETITRLVVYSFRKTDGAFAVFPKDIVRYILAMI
jgi:hypothetical protein